MSVRLSLPAGDGEAVALDGERLDIVSPRALAPGQPVTFRATLGEESMQLEGRSQGSKKRDDGRFDVRLRLVNLSRDERERLSRAFLRAGSRGS